MIGRIETDDVEYKGNVAACYVCGGILCFVGIEQLVLGGFQGWEIFKTIAGLFLLALGLSYHMTSAERVYEIGKAHGSASNGIRAVKTDNNQK